MDSARGRGTMTSTRTALPRRATFVPKRLLFLDCVKIPDASTRVNGPRAKDARQGCLQTPAAAFRNDSMSSRVL